MSSALCGVCPIVARPSAAGSPRAVGSRRASQVERGNLGSTSVSRTVGSRRASFYAAVGGGNLGSASFSGRGASTTTAALPPEAIDAGFVASDATVETFAARSMSDALEGTGVEEWQLWFGLWIGLSPFVIAAYEFGKRILIQRQCELCKGSGLIQKGRYARKCTSCGGFLPWQSWGQFFKSEAGNGGVVRVPKGQTSVFYDVEAARLDGKRQAAEAAAAKAEDDADAQTEDTPAR
jgi:hypothetical protein